MATIIRGGFKDNKERLVTIEIWSPIGMAEYNLNNEDSPIKISFDSVEIEYGIDDMFTSIIKKTMSINLVTTQYFGDVLFSDQVKQTKVTVKMDDNVLFAGYIEPYTYSQEYAHNMDEFTLNCTDELGCLEYQYIVQHSEWRNTISQEQSPSFKEYLAMMLPTNTYYDMSKTYNGASVFDSLGVSMDVFLGDSEDDLVDNEESLEKILKYFNLHIIQEGEDLYIFDWNTIKAGGNKTFVNIFDNTTKTVNLSQTTITADDYTDDSTNISISDTFNQIKLKVNLDTNDTVISDPLESEDIEYFSNYKQLWMSEYRSYGTGSSAMGAFVNIVNQGYENGNTIVESYGGWERKDWYFKLGHNPKWKLMWNGIDVNEWIEVDNNGNPVNLQRIFQAMKNYRFFPFIISCGTCEELLNRGNQSRLTDDNGVKGSIKTNDYIVISVNGNNDDSEAELQRIQTDIDRSSGYSDSTQTAAGLMVYQGNTSAQYSPVDDTTTNYLVFKGTIKLMPNIELSPVGYGGWYFSTPAINNPTFKQMYDYLKQDGYWPRPVYDMYYAHQFWKTYTPGTLEQQEPTAKWLYPNVDVEAAQQLEYNYSGHWNDTDIYNKLGVVECELKIGDKYLVETYANQDKQKPLYGWYTEENLPIVEGIRKRTFSLGFDPNIGECIVGKEYPITNTVNGKISDEKGMAVAIKKSDGLSGKVSFKIVGVINQQWNEITRRHPTLFRSTKYYDNWKNVWSHVSSIWIKDFEIGIISDNGGSDVPSKKKDIVYISDQSHGTLHTKDEEFDICTMPTTQELVERGIETNVAKNTCINLVTKTPTTSITDATQSVTDRPEKLWIDQYWNIYNTPRTIIETTLDDSCIKGMAPYYVNNFGKVIPLSIKQNLRNCEATISLQQINA